MRLTATAIGSPATATATVISKSQFLFLSDGFVFMSGLGTVDELRVYDRVLTNDELPGLYDDPTRTSGKGQGGVPIILSKLSC